MHIKTVTALALGTLLLAGSAWADSAVYKWVDDQGVVHYSTEPHGDNAKQTNIINTGNSLPTPSTAPFPASAAGAASASDADDAKLQQETPNDSPACKHNRERLTTYLQASSLYQVDAKGQKTALSDEAKAKALAEARNTVRRTCGSDGGQ